MGTSGDAPASAAQRRLWFLDRLRGRGSAYNVAFAVRLVGDLEVGALRAALRDLVDRHPVLRTELVVDADGALRQRVRDDFVLDVPLRDAAPTREELGRDAARPFAITGAPLVRAALHRAGPAEHVLALTLHHAVTDGWSEALLFTELAECYRARLAGRPPDLPAGGDYGDHARLEAHRAGTGGFDPGLAHWARALADPPAPPTWPGARAGEPSDAGAVLAFDVPDPLAARLRAFAVDSGTSLFMAGLCAFAVVVHRCTGASDLVVGVPVANRDDPARARLLGLVANTVAVRVSLAGAPSLRTVLRRVRTAVLGALSFPDVPFDRVIAEVAPGRDPVRVMCAMADRVSLTLPGVTAEFLDLPVGSVAYDLLLSLLDRGDGVSARLEHRTDLVDADLAARVAGALLAVLEALVTDADRPAATVDVLDAPGRARWARLNGTAVRHPVEPLHRAVERQADRVPGAVAVIRGAERRTYRELDRTADRYAALLRGNGVGPEDVVGVTAIHDVDLPARLLGVLKCGAAFLLLDPALPAARLGAVVEQARCALVLDDREPPASATRPDVVVRPDNAAYVTFTSGSTGAPKGVLITHAAIGNTLAWFQREYRLTGDDRVLQSTAVSFDPSVWQLFWPLVAGACAVLPDGPGQHRDPAELVALVRAHRVTAFDVVPGMLDLLLRRPDWPACTSLRLLVSGGEALPARTAARFAALGDAVLANHYGPAEAAIEAVTTRYDPGRHDGATVPIGRPLDNMRAHVLDAGLMPVPPGVVGELYLGGPGLARGYVGRPDLTAERFVADPFAAEPGARLYRTGDLVRLRGDELEYVGRADRQLKVRGHRVEPGEVEAVLASHPGVRAAAVRPQVDASGNTSLVAYCVTPGPVPDEELLAWCARSLPPALCPTTVVRLPALPVGPHGKVDHAALPDPPEALPPEDPGAADPPRTDTERLLAGHWARVLGRGDVDRATHFFAAGGHSLAAAGLVTALGRELGGHVPLRLVFDHPVLADLAAALDRTPVTGTPVTATPVTATPVTAPAPEEDAPLSPAQEQLWFLDQLDPGHHAYNAGFAVELGGPVDVDALRAAFSDVVARHEGLRTSFPLRDGRPVQRVAADAPPPAVRDVADVVEAVREHQTRPFDLAAGPVARACLFRGGGTAVLAVSVHHIVFDEWSRSVLWRDLDACYRARLRGEAPDPAPPPVRPARVAAWQRARAGEVLAHWLERLRDAPTVLDLPTDHPRPAVRRGVGAVVADALPPSTRAAVRELGLGEGATPFAVLLAAWAVVLARHAGAEDLLIGTVLGDRDRPELEPLVGFLADTVAIRADLGGAPGFRALVRRVRDTVLDAVEHRGVPFATLVEHLRPDRSPAHPPLVQVVFEMTTRRPVDLAGTPARDVRWETGTAKFDLALSAVDTGREVLLELEHDRDLFTAGTARRLLGHLRTVLDAAAAAPDTPVDRLPLLTAAERRALVEAGTGAARPAPDVVGVHELFERQARRTPDAIALVHGRDALTYRDLAGRANRLAHRLRARGVGPDVLVGLCCDRGVPTYVALLAVLKAGGAYVPLDPDHPPARLVGTAAEARPALVLAHGAPPDVTAELARRHPLHEVADLLAEPGPEHDPEPVTGAGDLAYVLPTSGTTGRPKGVAMSHGALASLMAWDAEVNPVRPGGAVLQYNSLGWDLSFVELFTAWQRGGRVVALGADRDRRDADAVVDLLERHRVERWEVSPTGLLNVVDWLNRTGRRPDLRLRTLVVGGERLQLTAELRAWLASLPGDCRVLNHYGPSEVSRATEHRLAADLALEPALPPVGRPLHRTRVLVLDRHGEPVPVGVAGELHVGGPTLARGYLHRPGLTAERFVPDPLHPGARLYRTGDVGRLRADGAIEFLRRADAQVKLRGYRIEPGEVETVLRDHPDVREAVVEVVGDGPREARLVAYVRPEPGVAPDREPPDGERPAQERPAQERPEQEWPEPELSGGELPGGERPGGELSGGAPTGRVLSAGLLRDHLAARLPAHAVPADYVFVTAFPLLSNGKVDRASLPAAPATAAGREHAPPGTPTERVLAGIWARALGVPRVGVHDDFFALGGHSLLATLIVADVRAALSAELSVRDLFAHRTVASLAAAVDAGSVGGAVPDEPPVVRRRSGARP